MKHELFEELDAFDPHWQENYRTVHEAAKAADVFWLFEEFLETPEGIRYLETTAGVFDYLAAIEAAQKAEEESSLPYKLNDVGRARS